MIQQQEFKELRDNLQKIVGQINAVIQPLHQLLVDISAIERYFDKIDVSLLSQETVASATAPIQETEKTQNVVSTSFKPSDKLADIAMALARNLENQLKEKKG